MILLILILILPQASTFPTSITSQYTKSLPYAIQSATKVIVSQDAPMPSDQILVSHPFDWPFVAWPHGFATFIEIQHHALRTNIEFHLFISSLTRTLATICYRDKSIPDNSNIKKITVRVFAFDTDLCPSIKTFQKEFQPQNVQIYNFDTGLDISKPITISCFLAYFDSKFPNPGQTIKMWIDCWLTSPTFMRVYTDTLYSTITPQPKKILVRVVYMNDNPIATFHYRYLSSDVNTDRVFNPSIPVKQHLMLGISSFHYKTQPISFILDASFGIVSPSLTSTSKTWYKCPTVIDHSSAPPPPAPIYDIQLTTVNSYSLSNNTLGIVYQNLPFSLTTISKSQIRINQSIKINILSIVLSNNMMTILCEYSENIEGLPIQIDFDWSLNDWNSTSTTLLILKGSPPLKVYSDADRKKPRLVIIFCQTIQYLYLAVFSICLLCNKLVGIEIMSLIQLTFYCMIPTSITNPIFSGLSQMRYVNGYNFKLEGLKQTSLSLALSAMDIKSNFLSNVNFMLSFIALCPVIFGILLMVSKYSNSYKHKPRTKKYALAAICEWSFTLLFFNCYNICSSMIVNIQSLGIQDPLSLFVCVIIGVLPTTALILYFFFRPHFKEFATEINQNEAIWMFSLNKSVFLSNIYPCVLGVQMILVPCFLAAQSLLDSSMYIVLGIIVVSTSCMILTMPYTYLLNNIRLFVHQILKIVMVGTLVFCKLKIGVDTQIDDGLENVIFVILGILILGLGLGLNVVFVFWRSIVWMKSNGIIDMKLYLDHMGKVEKKAATMESKDPMFYPALEYGIGRQALLDRENQKRRMNISNLKGNQGETVIQNRANIQRVQQQLRKQMINHHI